MGFNFGSIGHLEPNISLICFAAVIFFIVFFDHFLGLLEYFIEGSYLYHKMVQTMYKELMLTGFVSFSIMMFSAARVKYAEKDLEWILNIDFVGILISYITIFFVLHALYLMRSSTLNRKTNRRLFHTSVSELIQGVRKMKRSGRLARFLYSFKYLPLSTIRTKVEFFLCYSVFRDTYWLPKDFDYPSYLNGCYDRFALKTINRSLFSWLALFSITLLNYGRIRIGFGCSIPFGDEADDANDSNGTVVGGGASSTAGTAAMAGHGSTESSSSGQDDVVPISIHHVISRTDNCAFETTKLFLFCALLVFLFSLILTMISRVYKTRLCNRIGFHSTDEYVDFLLYSRAQEQKEELRAQLEKSGAASLLNNADERVNKISLLSLKHDIERVLDGDENAFDEDRRQFKELGDLIMRVYDASSEYINYLTFHVKLKLLTIFDPQRFTDKTRDIVTQLSSKRDSHIADNSPRGLDERGSKDLFTQRDTSRLTAVANFRGRMTMASNKNRGNNSGITNKNNINIDSFQTSRTPKDFSAEGTLEEDDLLLRGGGSSPPPHVRNPFRTRRASVFSGEMADPATFANNSRGADSKSNLFAMLNKIEVREKNCGVLVSRASTAFPPNGKATSLMSGGSGGSGDIDSIQSRQQRKNSVMVLPPEGLESTIEKYRRIKFKESLLARHASSMNNDDGARGAGTGASTGSISLQERIYRWFRCFTVSPSPSSSHLSLDLEKGTMPHCKLSEDFSDIYFFKTPKWYFRAIEFCILMNCLYGAIYVTNFITITQELHLSGRSYFFMQLVLVAPIFIVIPSIGYSACVGAMLSAIGELNLPVAKEVIDLSLEVEQLKHEFRAYIFAAVESLRNGEATDSCSELTTRELIKSLFEELDEDGSGELDRMEFRFMLRTLKLTYTDQRFNLLFLAIDRSENGTIGLQELNSLLFEEEQDEEAPNVNLAVGGGIQGLRSRFKSDDSVDNVANDDDDDDSDAEKEIETGLGNSNGHIGSDSSKSNDGGKSEGLNDKTTYPSSVSNATPPRNASIARVAGDNADATTTTTVPVLDLKRTEKDDKEDNDIVVLPFRDQTGTEANYNAAGKDNDLDISSENAQGQVLFKTNTAKSTVADRTTASSKPKRQFDHSSAGKVVPIVKSDLSNKTSRSGAIIDKTTSERLGNNRSTAPAATSATTESNSNSSTVLARDQRRLPSARFSQKRHDQQKSRFIRDSDTDSDSSKSNDGGKSEGLNDKTMYPSSVFNATPPRNASIARVAGDNAEATTTTTTVPVLDLKRTEKDDKEDNDIVVLPFRDQIGTEANYSAAGKDNDLDISSENAQGQVLFKTNTAKSTVADRTTASSKPKRQFDHSSAGKVVPIVKSDLSNKTSRSGAIIDKTTSERLGNNRSTAPAATSATTESNSNSSTVLARDQRRLPSARFSQKRHDQKIFH